MTNATILGVWYFWPLPFIAAADAVSPGGFPFGSLTSTGILCWYVWHTNSKALPGIYSTHAAEKAEMRDHYQGIIDSLAEANKESIQMMTTAIDKLTDAIEENR